ncbi:MAG: S41 family peptidase [Azospirillaceae bacterium]
MPRRLLALAAAILTAVLAACAPGDLSLVQRTSLIARDVTPPPRGVDPTVYETYAAIWTFHVAQPDFARISVSAFDGLQDLDPEIDAMRRGDVVILTRAGQELARYPLTVPASDAGGWAYAVTDGLALATAASPALANASLDDRQEAILDGATDALDRYSRYLTPDEAEAQAAYLTGYGGVGLLLDQGDGGMVVIREVFPNGPAAAAGVGEGWRIIAVDGQDAIGLELAELAERLRGPIGSAVSVAFLDQRGQTRSVNLRRAQVVPNVIHAERQGSIGIVEIGGFNSDAPSAIRSQVSQLLRQGPMTGLILDLRGNPGGLLDTAKEVADLFLASGEIVYTIARNEQLSRSFSADPVEIAAGVPMVVLIDGGSASASEILAGSLQDRGRAVVVGTTSYGKGSVQTRLELRNGGALLVTASRYYVPSGITVDQQGVLPTICTADAGTATEAIGNFMSGRTDTPTSLEATRRQAPENQQALDRVRDACPDDRRLADIDMEVALAVLADPAIYARALSAQIVALAHNY